MAMGVIVDVIDYAALQHQYGGRYIARRGSDVIAAARTYDELADCLEKSGTPWSELTIEFVEPADTIGVY